MAGITVEEPEDLPVTINITIVRTGGTLGVVTLDWVAMLDGKYSTVPLFCHVWDP